MKRMFGTDGVRGVANEELTPEIAFALGRAGALVLSRGRSSESGKAKVLIGRDTRISGEMLEAALVAGVTSAGADAVLVGVMPTPAVAFLTQELKCDAGVVISASHNPVEDNGIKFFAANGFKLPDELEDEIEALVHNPPNGPRPIGAEVGRVIRCEDGLRRYIAYLCQAVPVDLKGIHVALDCANGAASACAPEVLRRLGARVTVIHNDPDGTNINLECGSTHPESVQALVQAVGADLGIAHDGDADRVIAVDHTGALVDGDRILSICGLDLLSRGELAQGKIAATAYSNGGLIKAFRDAGGDVVITQAGDRYVLEAMLKEGLVLGGEQSGHIIFLRDSTTGDGILSALKLLEVMARTGKPLAELAKVMPVFPQALVNVRVRDKNGWDSTPEIAATVEEAKQALAPEGRIFIRPSGTEPVIRIMGEHPNGELVNSTVQKVAECIQICLGMD
ncbi:MAG TPA: phosphoglucosamine mutase [Firmicutes bacterium]|nr:MAG: phosphoglucosamine mutase [Peptococcaceae bacterium 1109]HHT72358.1 phosphoglucosamine mutase [Bacillota bacterium]